MSPGHYFDPSPSVASRPSTVELKLPEWNVELRVDRGVFAAGGVDPGTVELLRATAGAGGVGDAGAGSGGAADLLDVGCGYGPIACVLAHRHPDRTVWAVDVNDRALDLTRANATDLGLVNVKAVYPHDVPAGLTFGGIWSNPPIRVGKAALHEILLTWLPRLEPGGAAWLVVQRHLGADSLSAWLGEQGFAVRRAGSKRGYRIIRVTRGGGPGGGTEAGGGGGAGGAAPPDPA
jgi:16S rRNA G1207 methylase RsmC